MDELIERITVLGYATSSLIGRTDDPEINAHYRGMVEAYGNVLKMMGVTDV